MPESSDDDPDPAPRMGRPPEGANLVDKLHDCSEAARLRLKLIVQTLAGEIEVEEACQSLGINRSAFNRSAFNKLRSRFLADAAQLLEPKKPGRKPREETAEEVENRTLRDENERLKFQLKAQQLREEIGILMPHLLKHPKPPASRVKKRRSRRSRSRVRVVARSNP